MPEQFTAADGDGWHNRNAYYMRHDWLPGSDWPIKLLDLYHVEPRVICEVGCATGYRLAHLLNRQDYRDQWHPKRCIGVDISEAAIADGRKLYPNLELHVRDANNLPVADGLADVVICYFVMHWISGAWLPLVVNEIDRVLKVGGCLVLGDFAPDESIAVPYKHREGVVTYKSPYSYAGWFTADRHYREVCRVTFNHDTHDVRADVPSEQRAACVLLRKER